MLRHQVLHLLSGFARSALSLALVLVDCESWEVRRGYGSWDLGPVLRVLRKCGGLQVDGGGGPDNGSQLRSVIDEQHEYIWMSRDFS